MKKIIMFFLLAIFMSFSASANDKIYKPSLKNIVDTWVKYLDEFMLADRDFLDEYIALNYCEEKGNLFDNDIEREDFRQNLKEVLLKSSDNMPNRYMMVKPVLAKYNFDTNKLIINKKRVFVNVTNISLPTSEYEFECDKKSINKLNKDFAIDLGGRIDITQIDLPLDEARKHIPNMKSEDDKLTFYIIMTVDINGIHMSLDHSLIFSGDVVDIGYYTGPGEENRFGEFDFSKENKKYDIDYMKDLDFVSDREKATY